MTTQSRRKSILGKKLGMSQVFEADGRWIPVTILQAGPCTVVQVKTPETDGYTAVQLGFEDRTKQVKRPQQAFFEKIGVTPKRFLKEVSYVDPEDLIGTESAGPCDVEGEEDSGAPAPDAPPAEEGPEAAPTEQDESGEKAPESAEASEEEPRAEESEPPGEEGPEEGAQEADKPGELKPGTVLGVNVFRGIQRVDVRGVTKGRGFSGTIKRYGFSAGDKSHGSKNVREPGSTGMHTDPGRVLRGKKMPGHYGASNRKVRNLTVVRMDEKNNLLLVKGAVPGPCGGYVYIEESLKQGSS